MIITIKVTYVNGDVSNIVTHNQKNANDLLETFNKDGNVREISVTTDTGECFEWCQITPNVVPNRCSAWKPLQEKVCEILKVYESKKFSKDETEQTT